MTKIFLIGDSQLAIKNIPLNAVDKIQVLRNYSEIGRLSRVRNNRYNVMINIKLEEGKQSFWFGNMTAAVETFPQDELYLVQPKLFYYSLKYSLNFIGDINNTEEAALPRRDVRGLGGNFRAPSSRGGTSINL